MILNGVGMLKKYFYISILLGAFALSGCTDDEVDNKEVIEESSPAEQSTTINNEDNTKKTEEVKEVNKKEPVILDVTDLGKVAPIRGSYPLAIDEEITTLYPFRKAVLIAVKESSITNVFFLSILKNEATLS